MHRPSHARPRSRDTRLFTIYGYARLVGYDRNLNIVPDILESLEVKDGRMFTLHLRRGHRWSDGQPFTSEDFRYYWEDVANNKELSPSGPPRDLLVDVVLPRADVAGRRCGEGEEQEDAKKEATGHGQRFVERPDVPAGKSLSLGDFAAFG